MEIEGEYLQGRLHGMIRQEGCNVILDDSGPLDYYRCSRYAERTKMQTVAETGEFSRQAERLIGSEEKEALIAHLALNPVAGDLIEGTGGIRKLRWSRPGMGKRGGVRVIYYYHSLTMPLYLLTIYGKSQKDNLTDQEKAAWRAVVEMIKQARGVK